MHRRGSTAQDGLPAAHPSPSLGQCLLSGGKQGAGLAGKGPQAMESLLCPPLGLLGCPVACASASAALGACPASGPVKVRPDWSASRPRPFLPPQRGVGWVSGSPPGGSPVLRLARNGLPAGLPRTLGALWPPSASASGWQLGAWTPDSRGLFSPGPLLVSLTCCRAPAAQPVR